jgi:DNA invertase Pin-like site-specific DNA recombinase
LGIGFVSLREQIDTSTPTGKMVFTILGSVAELERSLIGERVKAGLRNAKAKGKRLGRPPLRELSATEVRQLRRDRRKTGESFKKLADRY